MPDQKAQLETFFDFSPDLLLIGRIDTTELRANHAWQRVLGYDPQQLTGRRLLQLVHKEDFRGTHRAVLKVRGGRPLYGFVNRLRHIDGSYRSIEWRGQIADQSFYMAGRDISDRKRTEIKLSERVRYEQGLAACSQLLLESVGDQGSAQDVIDQALGELRKAADADRAYIFTNFNHPELGLCMRQIHESCASGVNPQIHNQQLQCIPYASDGLAWHGILEQGQSIAGLTEDQSESVQAILRPQGIVAIIVIPLFLDGKWAGFIGFDETQGRREWGQSDLNLLRTGAKLIESYFERRRAAGQLVEAKAKAEEADRAKTSFLMSMTHEMRTPLNAVNGITESLLANEADTEKVNLLQEIRNASSSLLLMINNVLSFAASEAKQTRIQSSFFSLGDLITPLMEHKATEYREKRVPLRLEIDPAIPAILEGDPQHLHQVLDNLLGNALSFSEGGAVTLSVQKGDAEHVCFMVTDEGPGMTEDTLQHIFDPFSRSDGELHSLSLAVSKRLVEAMGGTIGAESSIGTGSRFTASIPLPPMEDSPLISEITEGTCRLSRL